MPRKAIRINAEPPDEVTAQKYFRFWVQGELYFHPEKFPRLTSANFFGNDHPLELEVGPGTCEWLLSVAAQNPDINYLAIDVYAKALYKGIELAVEQGTENVFFIRAPIQFTYPLLEANSLQTVYMHYPDPYLRSRGQHKIFNQEFLDAFHRALQPGGTMSIMSDHRELFLDEMLPLIEADPRWHKLHEQRYLLGFDPDTRSRYQKLWEKHDVEPLRFIVQKAGHAEEAGEKQDGAHDG